MVKNTTVLVTGINGYIACHVARELFAHGYKVRGTVRSMSKATHIRKLFAGKPLQLVEVKDIADSDLTEAMRGVQMVIHCAAPYHFEIYDAMRDMLRPAVRGTINVLAHAHRAGVKKVVCTSSFAAMNDNSLGGAFREHTYTAADWSPLTAEDACSGDPMRAPVYSAAKKLAEKAAWTFLDEHDDMDIVCINPPMIYGPAIHVARLEDLNTSSGNIYDLIKGLKEVPKDRLPVFCDVRDVAKTHVAALAKGCRNRRIPISSDEPFTWDMAIRFLQEERPQLIDRLPPVPVLPPAPRTICRVDNSYAKRHFKIDFIPWQTSLLDSIDSMLELELMASKIAKLRMVPCVNEVQTDKRVSVKA